MAPAKVFESGITVARYSVDPDFFGSELLERIEAYVRKLNQALGYEINTTELLVKDGIPYLPMHILQTQPLAVPDLRRTMPGLLSRPSSDASQTEQKNARAVRVILGVSCNQNSSGKQIYNQFSRTVTVFLVEARVFSSRSCNYFS